MHKASDCSSTTVDEPGIDDFGSVSVSWHGVISQTVPCTTPVFSQRFLLHKVVISGWDDSAGMRMVREDDAKL